MLPSLKSPKASLEQHQVGVLHRDCWLWCDLKAEDRTDEVIEFELSGEKI